MVAFVVRQMTMIHENCLMCSANSLSSWCVQQVKLLQRGRFKTGIVYFTV